MLYSANIPMNISYKFPSRRILGFKIGLGLGFLYSLISATINLLLIHDVPLYSNSAHILNQVFWATLVAGIMGLIVNWSETGFPGLLVASLLGAITIFIETLLRAAHDFGAFGLVLVSFAYMILPMAVLFIPLNALLRWAAGYFLQIANQPWWSWRSLRVRMILIIIAVVVGSMPLYSSEARDSLHKMDEIIRLVRVSGPEESPWAFKPVVEIVGQAEGNYSLEWTDDIRRFPFSLIGEENRGSTQQIVFAYFDSGKQIACLFGREVTLTLCVQVK